MPRQVIAVVDGKTPRTFAYDITVVLQGPDKKVLQQYGRILEDQGKVGEGNLNDVFTYAIQQLLKEAHAGVAQPSAFAKQIQAHELDGDDDTVK